MPPSRQLVEHSLGSLFILWLAHQPAIQDNDRVRANDQSGFAFARSGNNFSPRNACDIIGWRFIRMRPLPGIAGSEFELDADLSEQVCAPGGRGSKYYSGLSYLHDCELMARG